jgi:hypothetical protein
MPSGRRPGVAKAARDLARAHDAAPEMYREQDLAPGRMGERCTDHFQILKSLFRSAIH